jgi:hypothetical protein
MDDKKYVAFYNSEPFGVFDTKNEAHVACVAHSNFHGIEAQDDYEVQGVKYYGG